MARHAHAGITAALLAVTGLLAACTPSDPVPTTSPSPTTTTTVAPSPSPSTSSVDPAVAEAEKQILAAYQGFWDGRVAMLADPAAADPAMVAQFEQYAIPAASTNVESDVLQAQIHGIAYRGEPVLNPVVSNILPGDQGNAKITDCVDVANWQPVFVASGEPAVAGGQATKVTANVELTMFEGRWVVTVYEIDRSTPC